MDLKFSQGEMPKTPSREVVEEQCVRWAGNAAGFLMDGNEAAASRVGDLLERTVAHVESLYGKDASRALLVRMASEAQRVRDARQPPTFRKIWAQRWIGFAERVRIGFGHPVPRGLLLSTIAAVMAAILFSVLRAHCAEPAKAKQPKPSSPAPATPEDQPATPAKKPDKGQPKKPATPKEPNTPEPLKCAEGQSSSYDAETGKYSCNVNCPEGQSVIVTDGQSGCGCPGGQVYNIKAKSCETPN